MTQIKPTAAPMPGDPDCSVCLLRTASGVCILKTWELMIQ
jgi:hypothetical protein